MISGIQQVGKIVKKDLEAWETALEVLNLKEGKTYKIAKVNFNTINEQIEIDLNEEYKREISERKYKFIRLQLTGRQPQFFATFTDKKRLLGEGDEKTGKGKPYTIWLSIKEELAKFKINDPLLILKKLKEITESCYVAKANNEKKDNELNIMKIEEIEKFKEAEKQKNKRIKDEGELLDKFLKSKLGNNEQIALWTMLIDGQPVINMDFYNEILKKKIVEDKRSKGAIVCSMCSQRRSSYFDDFARLPLKYFINDKFGFSQNLNGDYKGNFVLCEDCYIDIFAGQKFISRELSNRVGLIDYMIIPEFIKEPSFNAQNIKSWSEYITDTLNPFKLIEDQKFAEKLKDYKDFEYRSNEFLLNYLFYELNNQELKIHGLIKDVSASNVREIRKVYKSISKEFKEFEFDFVKNDISSVYWLIPLRKSKTKIAEIPKITSLFSAILNREPLELDLFIKDFTLGIRSKYYENPAYNITDDSLESYIIQTNAFLVFLRRLNLIVGGSKMTDMKNIPNEFSEYIQKCGFNELQIALFLLGTLIGDIGSKQAKYGSKPILNKINFQGMTLDRIVILYNLIYEKLEQEKLLYPDKEKTYAVSKDLMDKNKNLKQLLPEENVYYLLSGYAFKSLLNIKSAESKKEVKDANQQDQQ